MTRESNIDDPEEVREFPEGVYYVRVQGDRHRMVDSDVVEALEEALRTVEDQYAVTVSLLTKRDGQPARVPLDVKLLVRDCYGRELCFAGTWEVVESEPGAKGLTLQTGMTNVDLDGVRGEVSIRIGQ